MESIILQFESAVPRRMVRAELMGSHTHMTTAGVDVNVWMRGNTFLARGMFQGRAFGETLGSDATIAAARLRQILTDLDNGTYARPTDRRKRLVSNGRVGRLTLRDLVVEFLAEKRQARGRQTANDYRSRLAVVLDFAESPDNLRRWPLAQDIDVQFARSLRAFLFQFRTTRNGRSGAKPKPLSVRQIVNVLECLRTLLHWARSAPVRKLPADWMMPVSNDIIGVPPAKNPLREDKLPLDLRIKLVFEMDRWQLCHLCLAADSAFASGRSGGSAHCRRQSCEGLAGVGERFKDANFTKGKVAFVLPYPGELRPILETCMGTRAEGPLLRSRKIFGGLQELQPVQSFEHLTSIFDKELLEQPPGTVQAEQDRKTVFRALLRRLGGVTEDTLAREFKKLLASVGLQNGATLYSLRSSVTTAMHRANLPHLEMRFLTGHATNDILNVYTSLDPVGAMNRYFETIRPLLDAVKQRCLAVGIIDP